ncbi:unnamed protein product [Pleuronectes platessa]|uniref:Uncharacterized protein n=1 Tax=Pleuronectes platessa TaxID=8262 RepID=A0A9N7VZD7_PLEPL|nr:unnamed protein product [Pleuronectes platessa]
MAGAGGGSHLRAVGFVRAPFAHRHMNLRGSTDAFAGTGSVINEIRKAAVVKFNQVGRVTLWGCERPLNIMYGVYLYPRAVRVRVVLTGEALTDPAVRPDRKVLQSRGVCSNPPSSQTLVLGQPYLALGEERRGTGERKGCRVGPQGSSRGVYWHSTGAAGGRRQEFRESKPEMRPNDSVSGSRGSDAPSHPRRLQSESLFLP